MASYLSPKLETRARPDIGEEGIYALEPLEKEELLIVWGGDIVDEEELRQLPEELKKMTAQVEEGLFQVSRDPSPGDHINHSCDPNAGMRGQIAIVAMRPIAAGEEICIDYAMVDGTPYDEFDCACGAAACRGHISGNDWQRPELWDRYAGYFSPYLQRRIDRLRNSGELPMVE